MSKWPEWWRQLAERVRRQGNVDLSIDEIRESVPTTDSQLALQSWWNALENPDELSVVGLIENGLQCQRTPETGTVERVTFTLT